MAQQVRLGALPGVGENLQDHLLTFANYHTLNNGSLKLRPNLQFHFLPFGAEQPNTDEKRDPWVGREFSILPSLICPGKDATTDEQIRETIRVRLNTLFHPVGTCKMGVDDLAVVDPGLRVRGIDNLRVADGSVMPSIIGGNTNAPIIMIAEKAAAMMLA